MCLKGSCRSLHNSPFHLTSREFSYAVFWFPFFKRDHDGKTNDKLLGNICDNDRSLGIDLADISRHSHERLVVIAYFLHVNVVLGVDVRFCRAVSVGQSGQRGEIQKLLIRLGTSFSHTTVGVSEFHHDRVARCTHLKKNERKKNVYKSENDRRFQKSKRINGHTVVFDRESNRLVAPKLPNDPSHNDDSLGRWTTLNILPVLEYIFDASRRGLQRGAKISTRRID